jgi:assimilatory nitrate reductase catalytic subunit
LPADAYGRLLLMPGAKAPVAVKAKGKQVCTCFNVSEEAIQAQLANSEGSDDQRLSRLQGDLKCGTNCGSCIPELRRLVKHTVPLVAA